MDLLRSERVPEQVAKAMTMLIDKVPDGKRISEIRVQRQSPESDGSFLFMFVAEVED